MAIRTVKAEMTDIEGNPTDKQKEITDLLFGDDCEIIVEFDDEETTEERAKRLDLRYFGENSDYGIQIVLHYSPYPSKVVIREKGDIIATSVSSDIVITCIDNVVTLAGIPVYFRQPTKSSLTIIDEQNNQVYKHNIGGIESRDYGTVRRSVSDRYIEFDGYHMLLDGDFSFDLQRDEDVKKTDSFILDR